MIGYVVFSGDISIYNGRGNGYGGMVQPSQEHVAPCVKGVDWGMGLKGLRMVAAF